MATVPAVGPLGRMRLPTVKHAALANGMTVLAVRRPGLPLASLRVVIPTSRPKVSAAERARVQVLGRTLLAGTRRRSSEQLADDLQRLGGGLGAAADVEDLSLSGSCLANNVPALLATAAEVLTESTFPAHEVETERERVRQELALASTQPSTIARAAVQRRLFPRHPYAELLADPGHVGRVTGRQLASHMAGRVGPGRAVVVVVADRSVPRIVGDVDAALGAWSSASTVEDLPPPPPFEPGPILVVHRAGAAQTNIRLAGPAPTRHDPDLPALLLALTAFGGYFSSRLTRNLREDKGWTYSPAAGVEHLQACSLGLISVDVATDVTAPAFVEILHELGRVSTLPLEQDELDAASRYRGGSLALAIQTQAGLASQLAVLAAHGLGPDYLRALPQRYAAVTLEQALAAAQRWLAPARFTTVMVGDAEKIVPVMEPIASLTVSEESPLRT